MDIYHFRKQIIEDDAFGLCAIQKRCYITGSSQRRCAAHEWLISRAKGPPKEDQLPLFNVLNMVLIDYMLHDAGLNPFHRLFIGQCKVFLHTAQVIEAWRFGTERTGQTLRQWLDEQITLCVNQVDADGDTWRDICRTEPLRHSTALYKEWTDLWRLYKFDGVLPSVSNCRSIGNEIRNVSARLA